MMYSEFLAMSGKEECYISYREYTEDNDSRTMSINLQKSTKNY